ncbi:hypothetical protein [Sandaracinus amylolyticus]|uniref:hypothetical protein n=1 Tax=Sandaracinus amylolyticus TaxID=927083 RepID=UPI001F418D4A|nr:hypothetical protein [Sandaracinus amylolyticus]
MRAKRTARTALEGHMTSTEKKIAKLEAEIARLRADRATTKKLIEAYDAEHADQPTEVNETATTVQVEVEPTTDDAAARAAAVALLSQLEPPVDELDELPEDERVVRRPARALQLGDLMRPLDFDSEDPDVEEDDDELEEDDEDHDDDEQDEDPYPYARSRRGASWSSWSNEQFVAAAQSLGAY